MLSRISQLRQGRDILVFASDLSERRVPTGIEYTDRLAIQDQLANLSGVAIDIVLETPGGTGEVVEDIIGLIRRKYRNVGMIIPGYAKSAGTIFAMAGDEILMGNGSSLGPIDGQLQRGSDKRFSADAFLEGLEKIKQEVEKSKKLNPAYIPILQNISPGEIQNCENIQSFSKRLVTEWLAKYKFKDWNRDSDGNEVTEKKRYGEARRIATELCSQSRWLTHARSITIGDLEDLGVKITNYSEDADLNEAITRYYILLRMSFESTQIYKIFETKKSRIYRHVAPVQLIPEGVPVQSIPESAIADIACKRCKHSFKIQVNLKSSMQLQDGAVPYPISTDSINCPNCNGQIDVKPIRQEIEARTGRLAVK